MVDRAAAAAATAAVVVAIVVALQRLLKRRTVAQSSHSACMCICVCVRRLSNVKRRKQIFWQKVAVAWGAVFIPATQRGRGVL